MENKEYYEEYIINNYGIPYVSFNNLKIDVIKDIVEALELVFNRYPRLADSICSLGNCEDINNQYNLFINSNKHKKIVWGEYLEDEHEIMNTVCYNPGLLPFFGKVKIIKGKMFIPNKFIAIAYGNKMLNTSKKELDDMTIKSSSNGFHPPHFNTFKSFVYHELGHVLTFVLELNNDFEFFNNIRKLSNNFKNIDSMISKYANYGEDIYELIAEAFSEYLVSPNTNSLINYIGKQIDKKYETYHNTCIFNVNNKFKNHKIRQKKLQKK